MLHAWAPEAQSSTLLYVASNRINQNSHSCALYNVLSEYMLNMRNGSVFQGEHSLYPLETRDGSIIAAFAKVSYSPFLHSCGVTSTMEGLAVFGAGANVIHLMTTINHLRKLSREIHESEKGMTSAITDLKQTAEQLLRLSTRTQAAASDTLDPEQADLHTTAQKCSETARTTLDIVADFSCATLPSRTNSIKLAWKYVDRGKLEDIKQRLDAHYDQLQSQLIKIAR